MTDGGSDADLLPGAGDGDRDGGEGGRGPTRSGVAAAAVIAVASLVALAPFGVCIAALDETIGARRLGLVGRADLGGNRPARLRTCPPINGAAKREYGA